MAVRNYYSLRNNPEERSSLYHFSLFRKITYLFFDIQRTVHRDIKKGKAIPLKAWTGPEGPRRLRLPDFKTIGK